MKKERKFNDFNYKNYTDEEFAQFVKETLPITIPELEDIVNRVYEQYQFLPKHVVATYIIQFLEAFRYCVLTKKRITLLSFFSDLHLHACTSARVRMGVKQSLNLYSIRARLSSKLKTVNINNVMEPLRERNLRKRAECYHRFINKLFELRAKAKERKEKREQEAALLAQQGVENDPDNKL